MRDEPKLRAFECLSEGNKERFCNNSITTSRYNFLTFLPLFLFHQFKKPANAYFLFVALLQQIPEVSPIGRYVSISVLSIIMLVLAIKEIIEDAKRHHSDSKMNNTMCKVFKDNFWTPTTWKNIYVGDIIKISAGETVPADILLLSTSDPNQTCYVQTSSLDGESSYKIKNCHRECSQYSTPHDWQTKKAIVKCDPPNRNLYEFNGVMQIDLSDFSLNNDNIMLRGCQLKNTHWVTGVVLYTGHETKTFLNSSVPVIKTSTIDYGTNILSFLLLGCIFVMTMVSTAICEFSYHRKLPHHWYLKAPTSPTSLIKTILTFFILYHNIIPISLISTVELVKVFQAYIINSDPKMRSKTSSNLSVINTSSVIEDLGTINYVFTDKTGTLTCNEMILRVIQAGSQQYYLDDNFVTNLKTGELDIHDEAFKMFIINLLICNSVVTVDDNDLTYQSSSPDEIAIVGSLSSFGFKFVKRTQQGVLIDYFGISEFWKILYSIEFTSERKRMSVIAMSPDNQYYMFTKGSDDVVLKRLKPSHGYTFEFTSHHLESFAKLGLRTLCVAYKMMSSSEVGVVLVKFKEALAQLENRRAIHDQVADTVESGLTVLGCTGIEDKLQEKVSETIHQIRGANIKIWMMTGDMMETAVNVGFSTALIDDGMKIYQFCFKSKQDCFDKLKSIIHQEDIVGYIDKNFHDPVLLRNMAVVLTGQDLQYLLSQDIRPYFLSIAGHCKTLICCRISPSQKTDIVKFVRENIKDSVTLAVGDGANDCSMIRSAHLGIGIAGKEGLHAVNAADVAIDEFQLLTQLLFVHGAGSYRRICNCIYFMFYKNLILNLLSFFYNFVTLFSGKSIVNKVHFSLFNSIYTAFIPFCFGLADKFISEEASKNIPILYWNNQKNYQFNIRRFAYWCINAAYHSFFIFLFCYLGMNSGIFNTRGIPYGIDSFETIVLMITVIVISLKSTLEIRIWNLYTLATIWGGFLMLILSVVILSRRIPFSFLNQPNLRDQDYLLLTSPMFYLSFSIPCIILFPDVIFHSIRNTWFQPSHLYIANLENTEDIDWNESCDVEKVKMDLENVTRKNKMRKKKYFGFAFSTDETPGHKNNLLKYSSVTKLD